MKQFIVPAGGGLENLRLDDVDEPGAPGPGEIRVDVKASSLNFHDYMVISGDMPPDQDRVPLADASGVVAEVGEGVDEFAVGDHVVSVFFPSWQSGDDVASSFAGSPGDGVDGYARESVVRPASWFTAAPEGWTHPEAATITTAGATAWRCLVTEGGLKPGQTVALLGTGGVSILALQIAKAMGARVAITSSSDEKLARARELGADITVNYNDDPEWGRTIKKQTGGADIVLESAGAQTLPQSLRAVKPGGVISLIGVVAGGNGEIPTALLMTKQVRLHGVLVGSRATQQEFVTAMDGLGIRPVLDQTLPMTDLAKACELMQGQSHLGKIALEW